MKYPKHLTYEEVIDALILEKYSDNLELTNNRDMFTKIKSLMGGESISKMDHIKDVILMLREYVKVGEVEKKKFNN